MYISYWKMGIFQPAMLVYHRGGIPRRKFLQTNETRDFILKNIWERNPSHLHPLWWKNRSDNGHPLRIGVNHVHDCPGFSRVGRQEFSCRRGTLQGTNISHLKVAGKMIFLFPWWDMLVPRRVSVFSPPVFVDLDLLRFQVASERICMDGLFSSDFWFHPHGHWVSKSPGVEIKASPWWVSCHPQGYLDTMFMWKWWELCFLFDNGDW